MKRLGVILIVCALAGRLDAFSKLEKCSLVALAAVSVIGLVLNHKKNVYQRELEHYKNGEVDRTLFERAATLYESTSKRYLSFCVEDEEEQYKSIFHYLKTTSGSVESFDVNVGAELSEVRRMKAALQVKITEWADLKNSLSISIEDLFERYMELQKALEELKQRIVDQKAVMILDLWLSRFHYEDEEKFLLGACSLDECIKKRCHEDRFPSIAFAEDLKKQIAQLKELVGAIRVMAMPSLEGEVKSNGMSCLESLERVYAIVIETDCHKRQCREKYSFEQQEKIAEQNRLEQKRRSEAAEFERQTLAAAQRSAQERRLLEERNRRKEIDQAAIDAAVCENNSKWERRVSGARNDLSQLKSALSYPPQVSSRHERALSDYMGSLRRHVDAASTALPSYQWSWW